MDVPTVDLKRCHLSADSRNNAGVGVAHARDIVVGVKVPPAVRVKQPDAFPSDELNRLVVKERRTMTKDLFVASE
jgi:hypothetical protein